MNLSYEERKKEMKKKFPKAEIRFKNESPFQMFLGFFVQVFNKRYMKTVTTTMFGHVYFPNKKFVEQDPKRASRILAHEMVHLEQMQRDKLFSLKYLFPQCLALLSLLSFVSWFFLLFLLFLAPWPAYWRSKYEYEAYLVTLSLMSKETALNYIHHLSNYVFTGPAYYYMSWRPSCWRAKFKSYVKENLE